MDIQSDIMHIIKMHSNQPDKVHYGSCRKLIDMDTISDGMHLEHKCIPTSSLSLTVREKKI